MGRKGQLDADLRPLQQRARWLTYGLGYSAVAVLLIIALVLALF